MAREHRKRRVNILRNSYHTNKFSSKNVRSNEKNLAKDLDDNGFYLKKKYIFLFFFLSPELDVNIESIYALRTKTNFPIG